jgi:predicted transcriptional regulator
MSDKKCKVRKSLRLNPKIAEKLPKQAKKEGRTETAVIERALKQYFVME